MATDASILKELLEAELARLPDRRVVAYVREHLVEPTPTMRRWDYGREDESFPCWTVLEHAASNTGIAYCEQGFGPRSPWGLVFLEGDENRRSIGMDSAWYTTFFQTFFESKAASDLPIWRVFRTDANGQRLPISDEGAWDETWSQVMALRQSDPANRYDCSTSIPYERE